MSLSTYKKKRKFNSTPEPKGKQFKVGPQLHFVVQKHQATQLHYDFRLEAGGVLKSWAVPKGPSLNTEDKRLAMMVEDHPLDYRTFEGIIPEGNYGAGTVMVWDEGNYLALGASDAKTSDKLIRAGIKKGELKFVLNGNKLSGGFAMIRLSARGGSASGGKNSYNKNNSWLLFKERDNYAKKNDITKKDKSALTNRSMNQIARDSGKSGAVWNSNKHAKSKIKSAKIKVR